MRELKRWRIVADDLSGALDTVAAASAGTPAPVAWDLPPAADAPLAALATDTRDAPAHTLASRLATASGWLADADLPYKKIDSLLRGNTFTELACILRGQSRLERILFAPALPSQGRFTAGDRHWSAPPHAVQTGPQQEICPSLQQAFAAVGLTARCGRTLGECGEAQVMVPWVRHDADLAALAAHVGTAAAADWLWAGSAGLAAALQRHVRGDTPASADCSFSPQGSLVVVTSSRHPVARGQLELLRTRPPSDRVRVFDWSPAGELPPAQARALLARQAQHLVLELPLPAALCVVGGDTLLALCRASGATHLSAGPSPRPGWGRARLCGGAWDGVTCHSRSGAFGAPGDLLETIHDLSTA